MKIRAGILAAFFALISAQALAQGISYYPQTIPANTVVGRISPVAGPTTAIPLTTLKAQFFAGETPVADVNYTMLSTDTTIVYTSLSVSRTVTLLPASSFSAGSQFFLLDRSGSPTSSKTISIAPNGSDTINGANSTTTVITSAYSGVRLETDGVSKWTVSLLLGIGTPLPASNGGTGVNNGTNSLTVSTNAGTLNFTASGKTLGISNSITIAGTDTTTMTFPSASATITQTIASGTLALATGAIGSGACTSAQTATATGTASTDTIIANFNADPTGTTGYIPSTSGMLTIVGYPTTNTVNFKVCNNTGNSITPGATSLNWRVVR